jgi:hypothetical protein
MTFRPSFTLLFAACVSILTARHSYAQDLNLYASINHPNPTGPGAVYFYTPAGAQGTALASVSNPRGLAFNCAGDLFVTSWTFDDAGNFVSSVLEITPQGTVTTFATGFPVNVSLEGLAIDSMGNVFVAGGNNSDPNLATTIFKITPNGGVSSFGTIPGQTFGLAFDSSGNLFAAGDDSIFEFTPSGTRTVFAGPTAFPATQGPVGLAFDNSGNLFVSLEDSNGNGGIIEFTPNATDTVVLTGLTNNPRGLATDAAGDLFVAEVGVGAPGDILKLPAGSNVPTVFAGPVGRPQGNGGPEFLAFPPEPCQFPSSIAANFNGTAIKSGSTIWFGSVLTPSGIGSTPVTYRFTNQTISSTSFSIPVPDAQVTFDPSATTATTTYTYGMWVTRVPASGLAGNTFFSGASYPVPANIPGGLKSVAWSGTISSDTPTASLQWKWSAAVYSSFGSDYNSDGIKPADDNKASVYQNSDHAGTPENYKAFVTGGATGGGGSNYTGSLSGTDKVGPCCPH